MVLAYFPAGLSQQFGAKQQIVGITKASATGLVQVTAHGYSVGDTVIMGGLSQSATTGMQQIAGIPFTINCVVMLTISILIGIQQDLIYCVYQVRQ